MNATAVLITKYDKYPQEVLDSLPPFDEVIVETNCPSILRRYELCQKAKNDLIYVQDDDCITDIEALFRAYDGRLTNAMTQHHINWYSGSGLTLIGYGAFFPKKMVNFDRYLDKFPVDELFLTQADRVFTYLNQPHNSVLVDINNLPRATDSTRMSTQSDHWSNLERIKQRLCEL